jgi:hypothetical protein
MGTTYRRRAEFSFKSRPELDVLLTRLEQDMPLLLERYPHPADFWSHYATITDKILTDTAAEDDQLVCTRLSAILDAHGLVSRDDIDQLGHTHPGDGDKRTQN